MVDEISYTFGSTAGASTIVDTFITVTFLDEETVGQATMILCAKLFHSTEFSTVSIGH